MKIEIVVNNKIPVLDALHSAMGAALEVAGAQAVNYTTLNLYPGHGLDTGRLRGSITHELEGYDTEWIGTNVEYAPYVELGHHTASGKKVAPIPFLKPAITNHVDEYREIIKRMLQNA